MIGIIADDTTGANDIGAMFAKHGWATAVVAHDAPDPLPAADALVLDTDSRLDPPERAYAKVHAATLRLRSLGCGWLHKKTCSVFRGNIGAEFDAMLDASGGEFALVSLAYPKNGRATRDGRHTVHGVPLEQSAFARDPVHPMTHSDLVAILQAQTRRRVGQIDLATVRAGEGALRKAIAARWAECQYCVVDGVEQDDLARLAAAAHDWPWHAGSAALAEELPRFWRRPAPRNLLADAGGLGDGGVLVVAGSLTPQTRAQTTALRATGIATAVIDSRRLFDAAERVREVARAVATATTALRTGRDALVQAEQADDAVAATKVLGARAGLDPLATSRVVSAALADAVAEIAGQAEVRRLVVAGGDTSGAICRRLGIRGNWVLGEVTTGVPAGLALGRPLLLVLKSGSFGDADFLRTAVAHLHALGAPAAALSS